MTIRTRFAPSPTGMLHIGGIRTALFSWLYAQHHQGEFVLRIEDTDRERSTDEAVTIILEGMEWLGLSANEEPIYQTSRFDRYAEIIQQLLEKDQAYYCYCSKEEVDAMREEAMAKGEKPRYNGYWRDRDEAPPAGVAPVVRFKNPLAGEVVVRDLIQGEVNFQNRELDDLIIARSDGTPTYNFTVAIDDMDMQISHVIRGDDHLNNTPRQMNILAALGANIPEYAHVPMILGPDGKKLSKRDGAASVLDYRDQGYLPEALLNYLIRLGWSHGDQELFSRSEMISLFDVQEVNTSAAAINPEKLQWLNQQYIMQKSDNELAELVTQYIEYDTSNGPALSDICSALKERAKTLVDLAEQARCYYEDFEEFDANAAKKHLRPVVLDPLSTLYQELESLETWQAENLHQVIEKTAATYDLNMGKIGQPLRVAITGSGVSPGIDITLTLVGRERTLQRMQKAIEFIRKRAAA